jgi:hypothetical protein
MPARRSHAHRREFSCSATARQKMRGAVARRKGIAARFAAHDDCLNKETKSLRRRNYFLIGCSTVALANHRAGATTRVALPAALTIHERCEQQEQQLRTHAPKSSRKVQTQLQRTGQAQKIIPILGYEAHPHFLGGDAKESFFVSPMAPMPLARLITRQ